MLCTCRLASYVPKGKEKQAMKQQKAMLIALIEPPRVSWRVFYL
ncbi:hypothetical protein ECDEC8A_6047 [Escherichia coli DEC8A]|nr:hypothetical protein ECDEC8A_6047 [Escherichia coli DEC8A]EIH78954.1 hypothetical protein EC40522_1436 [Escherichia coli 4.0522]